MTQDKSKFRPGEHEDMITTQLNLAHFGGKILDFNNKYPGNQLFFLLNRLFMVVLVLVTRNKIEKLRLMTRLAWMICGTDFESITQKGEVPKIVLTDENSDLNTMSDYLKRELKELAGEVVMSMDPGKNTKPN